jgi:DNA polymerase III epsilon subunit-like protein
MTYIMVDIEADGPIPGDYSMISLGAVIVEQPLLRTFYGQLCPLLGATYDPEALQISGFSREQTQEFDHPRLVMEKFDNWLSSNVHTPIFISDNNGFDWQFVNWYFHHFLHRNPFGFSSQNLGSLYKGLVKDVHKSFKHLRKTKHSHNPVDDARGNAEAFIHMAQNMGLHI